MGLCLSANSICCLKPPERLSAPKLIHAVQASAQLALHNDELLEQVGSLTRIVVQLQSQLAQSEQLRSISEDFSKQRIQDLEGALQCRPKTLQGKLSFNISTDTLSSFDDEKVDSQEIEHSAQLFKQQCELRLRKSLLQQLFNQSKLNVRPRPPAQVFKLVSKMLDAKYELDCADVEAERLPRPFYDFTLEYFKREKGLDALITKNLCELIGALRKLHKKRHAFGTIICRMLQIFDLEPVPDLLAWFLTRARHEFIKKSDTLCIGDVLNLVYLLFENDKLCRAVCFKLLRPQGLSVENFLLFRLCHKLLKQGTSAESFYSSLECEGKVGTADLFDGIKRLIDVHEQDREVGLLCEALDPGRTGQISKEVFLSSVNFKVYHHFVEAFHVTLSGFLGSLIETYKTVQIKDHASVLSYVKSLPHAVNFEGFKRALRKFDRRMSKASIRALFEEALGMDGSTPGAVAKSCIAVVVMRDGIGGRGVRDFANFSARTKANRPNDNRQLNVSAHCSERGNHGLTSRSEEQRC